MAKGHLLPGMSPIPAKSILQTIGKTIVNNFRSQNDFVKEREKRSPTLGIVQRGGHRSRSPHALSYEQLGCCADFIEANMESAHKKGRDLHKYVYQVKGTCSGILPTSRQDSSRAS